MNLEAVDPTSVIGRRSMDVGHRLAVWRSTDVGYRMAVEPASASANRCRLTETADRHLLPARPTAYRDRITTSAGHI
jgi:hypothetical protein